MTTEQSNEIRRLTLAAQQTGGAVSVFHGKGVHPVALVRVVWTHAFDEDLVREVVVLPDGSRL